MKNNPLTGNTYPGRGIVLGLSPDGKDAVQVYWTMGRSENSKNRILAEEDGVIKTLPFIDKDIQNPELIIYNAAMQVGPYHIVTNGRQTDTLAEGFKAGRSHEDCLNDWEFESDPPIYTPRVSGVTRVENGEMSYQLSIIKSQKHDPARCLRQLFSYSQGKPGVGHCIHTYAENGDPCPSFAGEPFETELFGSIGENMSVYWDILPAEYIVAMLVVMIDIASGKARWEIRNMHAMGG